MVLCQPLEERGWKAACQGPQEHVATISNPSARPAEHSPYLQVAASTSTGLSQRLIPTASITPELFLYAHPAALHPLNECKGWGARADYPLLAYAPHSPQLAWDSITLHPSSQETHNLKLLIHLPSRVVGVFGAETLNMIMKMVLRTEYTNNNNNKHPADMTDQCKAAVSWMAQLGYPALLD